MAKKNVAKKNVAGRIVGIIRYYGGCGDWRYSYKRMRCTAKLAGRQYLSIFRVRFHISLSRIYTTFYHIHRHRPLTPCDADAPTMNDSDDLFGGLPAVANAENAAATATIAPPINVDLPAPVPSDVEKSSSSSEAEKRKGGASLISSLGSAGTAMVRSVQPDVFIDRCSLFDT